MNRLHVLDARIATRCATTSREHPWWPCASGCDHCCRSLPRLPTISRTEWERLAAAIAELPDRDRSDILERIHAADGAPGPTTCPVLSAHGVCRAYEARPIVCRTYGFYTERDAGLHCGKVTAAIDAAGQVDSVVWGNGEAVNDDLRKLGETRSLRDWLTMATGVASSA